MPGRVRDGDWRIAGARDLPATEAAAYLNAMAQDELNHVRAIQATIYGQQRNAGAATDDRLYGCVQCAGERLRALGPPSIPFSSPSAFLVGAFVFEDVGVTAYNGAAPLISSNAILDAAAGIAAVEAYHAAEIRTLLVGLAAQPGRPDLRGLCEQGIRAARRRWAAGTRRR